MLMLADTTTITTRNTSPKRNEEKGIESREISFLLLLLETLISLHISKLFEIKVRQSTPKHD